MKIDIQKIDSENFRVTEREGLILVCAKPGTIWADDNLIFRSSAWTKEGELVSPSFKKFFNWDEKPEIEPKPHSMKGCNCIEKIDGSTLIVSNYRGKIISRTRGTLDASVFDNGSEIDTLKDRYPKAFQPPEEYSHIFEWVSPENRIILNYGPEPDLYLTNIIYHKNYSYATQSEIDKIAESIGVKRPKVFNFDDVQTMIDSIIALEGAEGICVYYNVDQYIRKVKSLKYLTLHRMKDGISDKALIKYYAENNMPSYQEFIEMLSAELDFEIVSMMTGSISRVVDSSREVKKILAHAKKFADGVRDISRKDAAAKIFSSYGKTNKTAIVFNYLDNKEPDAKMLKTLLTQEMLKGK